MLPLQGLDRSVRSWDCLEELILDDQPMRKSLVVAFTVTDSLFLLYWTVSGFAQAGLIHIPRAWMYADFDQPQVVAWNWSFLPIDLAFSILGISAVVASRQECALWRPLALLSLAFTIAAGAMAVGYWLILQQLDPGWLIPNLALVIWPIFFLPRLVAESGRETSTRHASGFGP